MFSFIRVLILACLLAAKADGVLPEDVLKDDQNFLNGAAVVARKGSVFATILNIEEFDQMIARPDSDEKTDKIKKIKADLAKLIPALHMVHMFELFSMQEWLAYRPGKEGRLLVGVLFMQHFPEYSSQVITSYLQRHYDSFSKELQIEIDRLQ